MSIQVINPIPFKEPPKEQGQVVTLGMVLAMIAKVTVSINESYESAGETNRKFIELTFDFIKKSAQSMKTAELWKAGGMALGGLIGLGMGVASLNAAKNLAAQAKTNAPQIQQKADQIRALNRPQLGSDNLVLDRVPQGVNQRAQNVAEIRAEPHPANRHPRMNDNSGPVRMEVREHREHPRGENNLTEGEKNREVRALEMEKELLEKQDPNLSFWANAHIAAQPVSQALSGTAQAVASGYEETGKVEQGTSRAFEAEQGLANGVYGNLHQTIIGLLVTDSLMQSAISASRIQ